MGDRILPYLLGMNLGIGAMGLVHGAKFGYDSADYVWCALYLGIFLMLSITTYRKES